MPANIPLPDVLVPVSQEAVQRAGIIVSPVTSGALKVNLRLPGVVEPNAYGQVTVTPVVTGRLTRVSVALGDHVRRGQTMAHIYSPDLADAQTQYISARAMLDAHERELQRTHKLADIGAASRQELERIHAEHESQTAAVQTAGARLELLGMSAPAIKALASDKGVNALTSVPAPSDGVVTERTGNVGLNVDPSTKLFTVADLSTVWVVADVYEKDLSQVRVGTEASIGASALPQLAPRGRVSYIDPQISTETRTAKVRIEVPNPRSELRFGMYVDVTVSAAGGEAMPTIPRQAVQNVGNRTVVYIANANTPGTFIEREVRLGAASGEQVEVTAGLSPDDNVVTEGSFFVRAERERLGLRGTDTGASRTSATQRPQTAKILVNEQGFQPGTLSLRSGIPAQLTFIRTTDKTCATEVVFPTENITRELPLNQPVVIELIPSQPRTITFACGMKMFEGTVVVE